MIKITENPAFSNGGLLLIRKAAPDTLASALQVAAHSPKAGIYHITGHSQQEFQS